MNNILLKKMLKTAKQTKQDTSKESEPQEGGS